MRTNMIFPQKDTLKDDLSSIIEKNDMVFLLIGKLKTIKKVYLYKKIPMILYTFMETFIGIFIYCFPMKTKQKKTKTKTKTGNLIYRIEI